MLTVLITSILITLGIALALILSQRPGDMAPGEGLDFTKTLAGERQAPQEQTEVPMRDGFPLQVRRYASTAAEVPLVILVHGSGWHGLQFDPLARRLSEVADVVVPDLRGHGAKPGRRGDVDYIGQYEDDLADLITAEAKPGQKVVLGGHSSGGGLVVRFAGGDHGALMDRAVLLAPFLHHNAPTMRENSGGWTQVLLRRMIGLSMLNMARIRALNHLTVIQLRMPQAVLDGPLGHTATTAYSYRLNAGYAPRGAYVDDIAALPRFLLIVGKADEAFKAEAYPPLIARATGKASHALLDGVGHLDVVDAPMTTRLIKEFLDDI